MTLIFLLIALGLDYFLGSLEKFRQSRFSVWLYYQLEKQFSHNQYWDGVIGLLSLMALPVLTVIILGVVFDHWSWFAEVLFTLIVLIYCLAPEKLDDQLDNYITAIDREDANTEASLSEEIINKRYVDEEDSVQTAIIKSALIDSHKRTFAVIFWFLILGVVGAVLYRLVEELNSELEDIHGGFAESTTILLNILEWPTSRLYIIGLALAGSLVHALAGWKDTEHLSFEFNKEVLMNGGIGALQYYPDIEVPDREKSYWIGELKSLINRTLIIWLAVLGIMTLSGTLG